MDGGGSTDIERICGSGSRNRIGSRSGDSTGEGDCFVGVGDLV